MDLSGTVMGYELDDRRFESRKALGIFLITTPIPALGPTQPPIKWVPVALSLRIKQPVREAEYSLPSRAEVKNEWNYTSTPQYAFIAWWCSEHRNNLTFTFRGRWEDYLRIDLRKQGMKFWTRLKRRA
jgi:hypothetical protein